MSDDKEFRENFEEFWEKYGARGFLKLYLSKYLFNIVMSQIKAKCERKFGDMGSDFHLKNEKPLNWKKSREYQNEIFEECKRIADTFVENLEKDENFSGIFNNGDIGRFIGEKKKLFEIFEKKIHESIQKYGDDHEKR